MENKENAVTSKDHEYAQLCNKIVSSGLRGNCDTCFGLCCVALYCSASDGFPADKAAGLPCINLQSDFRCRVHGNLLELGLRGCIAFDCFGAGQKVSQICFAGNDWSKDSETAKHMFEVFLVMRQLHEMLWYLTEAVTLQSPGSIYDDLISMLDETEHLTHLNSDSLVKLNVEAHRDMIKPLLLKTSEFVRAETRTGLQTLHKRFKPGSDLSAADLRGIDLIGANLRGACLIAANLRDADLSGTDFLGADVRDTDFRGANLSKSIFVTQVQLTLAKGDANTRIPPHLDKPSHWGK